MLLLFQKYGDVNFPVCSEILLFYIIKYVLLWEERETPDLPPSILGPKVMPRGAPMAIFLSKYKGIT